MGWHSARQTFESWGAWDRRSMEIAFFMFPGLTPDEARAAYRERQRVARVDLKRRQRRHRRKYGR